LLNSEQYDGKIDIWAVGCIIGELIVLEPIFRGTDQTDQLRKIFEKIGTPDPAILNEICIPGQYKHAPPSDGGVCQQKNSIRIEFVYEKNDLVEAAAYVTNMPAQPAQDFNELFGFKHREGNNEPISGVSPQGTILGNSFLSHFRVLQVLIF
jgi:serine/threonine protein kinase